MNWGYRVTILYLGFVAFMLTMVFMTFQHKVNLIAPDYYKKEMAYQDEINKMNNLAALEQGVQFQYKDKMLWLELPSGTSDGEILFFRPADGAKDFKIALSTAEDGKQAIPTEGLDEGLWRLKIDWKSKNKNFYNEQRIKISKNDVEILENKIVRD